MKSPHVLFFSLIIAAAFSLMAIIVGHELFYRQTKDQLTDLLQQQMSRLVQGPLPRVIALGDSHLAEGLDLPATVFFNAAFSGDCFIRSYLKLKQVLAKRPRPQIILLGLDGLSFSETLFLPKAIENYRYANFLSAQDVAQIKSLAADYDEMLGQKSLVDPVSFSKMNVFGKLKVKVLEVTGLHHFLPDRVKTLPPMWWNKLTGGPPWPRSTENGRIITREQSMEWMGPMQRKTAVDNRYSDKWAPTSPHLALFKNFFFKILRLAQENHIKVVLIHPPFYPLFKQRLQASWPIDVEQIKQQAMQEFGVEFWDFSDLLEHPASFADVDHVSKQGISLFSAAVQKRLEQLLPASTMAKN